MAITGSFLADFSSFQNAVAAAEVSLKSFAAGSGKVETALTRVVNSLSGTQIVQQATLAAEAVERIGGVSKLTEAELARVSATAKEAAAKLVAMGQEVPPGIQKIADATQSVDTAHGSLIGTLKSVALGFAAMFTARAAFNFINATVQEASALKDLAQQTHINVEEVQVLAGAMSEFGVDADTLARGLFTLSRKVAGGDDSVEKALATMGMSLKDLDGLNGKELFLKIESGLATLQGGLRDDTATEIFGSRLGMAMAGASEGIEGAIATWQRMNTVMSVDTVNALDQYDEAIKRAESSLSAMAANLIGPVAQGFNVLTEAVNKGASAWSVFWAVTKDAAASWSLWGTGTANLTKLLDDQNQKTDAGVVATTHATTAHHAAAAALTTHATSAHQATAAVKALSAEETALASAMTVHWAGVGTILDRVFGAGSLKTATQWVDAIDALGGDVDKLSNEQLKELEAAMLAGTAALGQMGQLTSAQSSRFAELALKAHDAAAATRAVATEVEAFDSGAHFAAETLEAMPAALEPAEAGIARIGQSAQQAAGGFLSMSAELYNAIRAAQAADAEFGAATSGPWNPITGYGHAAGGGDVSSGEPIVVGELGPEVFVPRSAGTIVPNGARGSLGLGGGVVVQATITVQGSVVTERDLLQRLKDGLLQTLKSSLQLRPA